MTNFKNPIHYDIEVEVRFLTTQEGGRMNPVFSGYRPQFHYNDYSWDAAFFFIGKECVELGNTTKAYVVFLSPELQLGRVYAGLTFEVREGQKTIGKGKIIKILDLAQSAKVTDRERPRRYYVGYWPEARSDEYAHWGGATYYFECLSSGHPVRQIEIYDNGVVLIYNEQHVSDQFGMLSDQPIEPFHKELKEISVADFEAIVEKVTTNIFNQP